MQGMTTAILASGIKVGNFSSAHTFTFDDGTVLPACSDERCRYLMLETNEREHDGIKGTTSIELEFSMSGDVWGELGEAERSDVDIVLVPLPVLQCYREMYGKRELIHGDSKVRGIRMVDRVKKICSSTRFCV